MFDIAGILFALLGLLVGIFWFIVVPILLLIRTKTTGDRLGHLEHRFERLRRAYIELREAAPEVPTLAEVQPVPAQESAPAATAPPESPRDKIHERPRQPAPQRSEERPRLPMPSIDLEGWVGRRGLGWLAVVLLLFAVAFFLKQAFDNGWIGELGRVLLGILAGAALTLFGFRYHQRGFRIFSQMVTSAGAVLLYLSTYAAFGFYHFLEPGQAGLFLVVLIVEVGVLALLYDAPAIAIMAVIGGLLTPVLLDTGQDLYRELFLFLGLLNLGVVGLLLIRPWPIVGTVALAGTQLLFGMWMASNYQLEKLHACLWFQSALFVMYLVPALATAARHKRANIDALIRLLLNACLSAVMLHVLLFDDYRPWLGSLALVLALAHALVACCISATNPADTRQLFVVTAIVMSLIAMVFPWQLDVAWIGVGWAVEGALLWWFGLRVRTAPLRLVGAIFLVLALGRLLFVDTPQAHLEPFVPILNSYAIPALAIAACIIATAVVSRYSPLARLPLDRAGMWAAGITGVLLTWLILSTETWQYFYTQIQFGAYAPNLVNELGQRLSELQARESQRLERVAQMSLSLVWALYAGLILAVGFWRHNAPLRWTALGLFGLTLGKVMLVDLASLPGFYRVAVFFALAIVLGVAARVYQRSATLLEAKS